MEDWSVSMAGFPATCKGLKLRKFVEKHVGQTGIIENIDRNKDCVVFKFRRNKDLQKFLKSNLTEMTFGDKTYKLTVMAVTVLSGNKPTERERGSNSRNEQGDLEFRMRKKMHVSNIPQHLYPYNAFRYHFERFGQLQNCFIKDSKRFGFITYMRHEDACNAINYGSDAGHDQRLSIEWANIEEQTHPPASLCPLMALATTPFPSPQNNAVPRKRCQDLQTPKQKVLNGQFFKKTNYWSSLNKLPSPPGTRCVLAQNIDTSVDMEIVQMHFQSKERSSGGFVENIVKMIDGLLIVFQDDKDCESCLKKENQVLEGKKLNIFSKTIPSYYGKRFILEGVADDTTHNALVMYLEQRSENETSPISCIEQNSAGVYLVEYGDDFNIAEIDGLLQKIRKWPLGTRSFKAKRLLETDCLKATGVLDDDSTDEIRLLFQSERRVSGGPVTRVDRYQDNTALIYFTSFTDAERIYRRFKKPCVESLILCQHPIEIELYYHSLANLHKNVGKDNSTTTTTTTTTSNVMNEERLEDVFQDEILKAFTNTPAFKKFARSSRGLCLDDYVIQDIVENHERSMEEQKLQMLNMWKEKKGKQATVGQIRNLLARYKKGEDPEGEDPSPTSPCPKRPLRFFQMKPEIPEKIFFLIRRNKKFVEKLKNNFLELAKVELNEMLIKFSPEKDLGLDTQNVFNEKCKKKFEDFSAAFTTCSRTFDETKLENARSLEIHSVLAKKRKTGNNDFSIRWNADKPIVEVTGLKDDVDKTIKKIEELINSAFVDMEVTEEQYIILISCGIIEELQKKFQNVHIKCDKKKNRITLSGPDSDVSKLQITAAFQQLTKVDFVEPRNQEVLNHKTVVQTPKPTSNVKSLQRFFSQPNSTSGLAVKLVQGDLSTHTARNVNNTNPTLNQIQIPEYNINQATIRKTTIDLSNLEGGQHGSNHPPSVRRKVKEKGADNVIPSTWEDMKGDRFRKIKLSPTTQEYTTVENTFIMAGGSRTILKIERIQNPDIYKLYVTKKAEVTNKKLTSGNPVERELFHGTSDEDKILLQGFNRSSAGKNATVWGKGVYFATTASYSDHFTPADAYGLKRMFLANVVTGDYCLGNSAYAAPPQRLGTVKNELYDSVVDNAIAPSVFVIFKDASAYPTYLITYT